MIVLSLIPMGCMASPDGRMASDDEAAKRQRERIKQALLRGERITVSQEGKLETDKERDPNKPAIVIPDGKLA